MSNDFDFNPSEDADNEDSNDGAEKNPDVQSQEIQHSQIGALVPENVARGVFSTGAVVLNGSHEFVVDFLLRMTRPHQVAARVVIPPPVVPRMIQALTENIENYKKRAGQRSRVVRPAQVGQDRNERHLCQCRHDRPHADGVFFRLYHDVFSEISCLKSSFHVRS
jgi:hypothetical protein